MNLFRRLFGIAERVEEPSKQKATQEKASMTPRTTPEPAEVQTAANLSKAEKEFLARLHGKPIHALPDYWDGLVGSTARTIRTLLRAGFIKDAPLSTRIDATYKVTDLKPILKAHGLKQSGKKAEVIGRLCDALSESELRLLVPDEEMYVATEAGSALISRHRQDTERERDEMRERALSYLRKGDVRNAGRVVAEFETDQVFPRGLGIDWSQGFTDELLRDAEYLLKYPYDELEVRPTQKEEIATCLALHSMLGTDFKEIANSVLMVCDGVLPCPSLHEFLLNPTGYLAVGTEPDDPEAAGFLFAHTMLFRASSEANRKELIRYRVGKGIEILIVEDEPCRICHKGKLKYRWSEIGQLPKLPRHWGCRCVYNAWL